MAAQGSRIVLGLDYGTTYTGLAWMQTNGQDNPSLKDMKLYGWTGDSPKVPSVLSYSKSEKGCKQWGFDIQDDSEVMRWTKLDLEPRAGAKELETLQELVKGLELVNKLRASPDAGITNDIPRQITKDAEDVVRDYLGKVARDWYYHMRSLGRHTLSRVPLDIVVTHPAAWSSGAKIKTLRAVEGAFHSGMFPTRRDIFLVSEPEACALYTVQDLLERELDTLIPGECFVTCDAGGGTIDLVSYYIESIDPLSLTRVGGISGGKHGSTFVDRSFLEWLRPVLRNDDIMPHDFRSGGHFVLKPRGQILLKRFQKVKHGFTGTGTGNINLPRDTEIAEGYEDAVVNRNMRLTSNDLQGFFKNCVAGVIRLIAGQVTQVENSLHRGRPNQVTHIFLAGGFSESEYLYDKVKGWARERTDIEIVRASDCWSGVVKGAVLRGMGIGMDPVPKVTRCRRHYGISLSETSDDRISWLVQKDTFILPGEPITLERNVECRFTTRHTQLREEMQITFCASAKESPPYTMSSLLSDQGHLGVQETLSMRIRLALIPQQAIRWANDGTNYGTANVKIILDVYESVAITLHCEGTTLGSYSTAL